MQLDELRVDIPTSLNTNLVHFVELKISCDLTILCRASNLLSL